jgi:NAD-dependent deacetylase
LNIVILTGAGISAESGVPTFRSETGLWNDRNVDDVATPRGFMKDRKGVLHFYNDLRKSIVNKKPNPAHLAITKLQDSGHTIFLVTQNVDDLHEKAGYKKVYHMHGSLAKARCEACEEVFPSPLEMTTEDKCPSCFTKAVRPDIVWFEEFPKYMETIGEAISNCDIFIAIGTSGNVYPAAGFARHAKKNKARRIEFNTERSKISNDFTERFIGPAGMTFPKWVDEFILNNAAFSSLD